MNTFDNALQDEFFEVKKEMTAFGALLQQPKIECLKKLITLRNYLEIFTIKYLMKNFAQKLFTNTEIRTDATTFHSLSRQSPLDTNQYLTK